jgi:hypothetical protein
MTRDEVFRAPDRHAYRRCRVDGGRHISGVYGACDIGGHVWNFGADLSFESLFPEEKAKCLRDKPADFDGFPGHLDHLAGISIKSCASREIAPGWSSSARAGAPMKLIIGAVIAAAMLSTSHAWSQPTAISPAPSVVPAMLHIPEGTELSITFKDAISSQTSAVGDVFTISSDEPVTLANGAVLPGGLIGAGEVTSVHRKGMMGKAGDLNVRLNYLKLGAAKIRLRGSKGAEGEAKLGTTVVLTVLFGPLGLLKHGHDVTIAPGQKLKAYVDQDIDVALPSIVAASAVPGSALAAAH